MHKPPQCFFLLHPSSGWKVGLPERPWDLVFPLWLRLRVLALQVAALSEVPFEFNSGWNELCRQARAKLTAASRDLAKDQAASCSLPRHEF
jgi:hypothetical protein